jgi:hypothetical protein
VVRTPHQLLTTWIESWGFIKLLAQNKAVNMELNLRLSFQLSRSLEGYKGGTGAGF